MSEQKQITSRVKNNGIGIYCIKNQNNKKLYIGQSRKLGDRVQQYISQLENGTHPNIELLEDYKKGDRFFIHTILYAPAECLDGLEIYYILKWSTHIVGYNTRIGLLDSITPLLLYIANIVKPSFVIKYIGCFLFCKL